MTRSDHHEVMKSVKISELKARLSEYLRDVRRGEEWTVMERTTPVARIVPYTQDSPPLDVRPPRQRVPRLQDVKLPPALKLDADVVDLLLEEREKDR